LTKESWQRTLDINLTGEFSIMKAAWPVLVSQRYGTRSFLLFRSSSTAFTSSLPFPPSYPPCAHAFRPPLVFAPLQGQLRLAPCHLAPLHAQPHPSTSRRSCPCNSINHRGSGSSQGVLMMPKLRRSSGVAGLTMLNQLRGAATSWWHHPSPALAIPQS